MLPKTITEVVVAKLAEVSDELNRTNLKAKNLEEVVKSMGIYQNISEQFGLKDVVYDMQ